MASDQKVPMAPEFELCQYLGFWAGGSCAGQRGLRKALPSVLGAEISQNKAKASSVPDICAIVTAEQIEIGPIREGKPMRSASG
jgi:hypothetical protein